MLDVTGFGTALRQVTKGAALVALAALVAPGGASAGGDLGYPLASGDPGSGVIAGTFLQVSNDPGSMSYAAATDGVITAWSVRPNDVNVTTSARLIVFRAVSTPASCSSSWLAVGESDVAAGLIPHIVNTYATHVPVRAGDRLGFAISGITDHYTAGSPADNECEWTAGDEPASGSTSTPDSGPYSGLIGLSARLEPDADGDGYGDETQDLCPANASIQVACPRPPTIALSGTRRQRALKRGAVRVTVTANENGVAKCTGVLKIAGAKHDPALRDASATLVAGSPKTLDLKLTRGAKRALRRAARAHAKARASLTVTITTASGLSATTSRSVLLADGR